jgi:hypothetical protein
MICYILIYELVFVVGRKMGERWDWTIVTMDTCGDLNGDLNCSYGCTAFFKGGAANGNQWT